MARVSVVVPTYNRPELLRTALVSVLEQDVKDIEVYVIDDGTMQRADGVVSEFKDARLHYIRNEISLGAPASRNRGVAEASTEFVAFLDDDDAWLPGKLSKQLSILEVAAPEVGFCFGSVINVYDTHQEVTVALSGEADYSEMALKRFNGFMTSTLMVRRQAFIASGGFDESFPSHQEAELMIRLTRICRGVGISEPLARMSISANRPHIGGDIRRRIRGREMLLEKHKALYMVRPHIHALMWFRLAFMYRDAGMKEEAQSAFEKAWHISHALPYLLRSLVFKMFGR